MFVSFAQRRFVVNVSRFSTQTVPPTPRLINLWAAPRTSSTSLMYSFGQRSDSTVVDEPLYAFYLKNHPEVYRVYRDEVLKAQSSDAETVMKQLAEPSLKPIRFAKHISKQLPPIQLESTKKWLIGSSNVLLIRDPKRVLMSWLSTSGQVPTLADSGFPDLIALLPYADGVVMNEDLLQRPEGTLRALCLRLNIPFERSMLTWPKGGRPEDGLWAKYWYQSTHAQTHFSSRELGSGVVLDFPASLNAVLKECMPLYTELCRYKIRPQPVLPETRNQSIKVWVNDRLVSREDARVSVFDSVVQGGDAVWEGLRVYEGKVFALEEHLNRLINSAKALKFDEIPTFAQIKAAILATLQANHMTDGVHIRLTLTRGEKVTSGMSPTLNQSGCTLIVLAEWKPLADVSGRPINPARGTRLITSSQRRNSPMFLDSKIHHNNLLNNILAKIEANNAGVDDAIMLDIDGFVAETNSTNIFIVDQNGVLLTPHADACLPGITRGIVLRDIAPAVNVVAREARISLVDVYSATECFTCGTLGELVPVVLVDGRVIGNGARGPVTEKLQNHFKKLTASKGTPISQ